MSSRSSEEETKNGTEEDSHDGQKNLNQVNDSESSISASIEASSVEESEEESSSSDEVLADLDKLDESTQLAINRFIKRVARSVMWENKLEDLILAEIKDDEMYSMYFMERDNRIDQLIKIIKPHLQALSDEKKEEVEQVIDIYRVNTFESKKNKELNKKIRQWIKSPDKNIATIGEEIKNLRHALNTWVEENIKLKVNIQLNTTSISYRKIASFLMGEGRKEILNLVGCSAENILNNIKIEEYEQIIQVIMESVDDIVENYGIITIIEFDRIKAKELWEKTSLKKTQAQDSRVKNSYGKDNQGLVQKLLNNQNLTQHLLLDNEIQAVIKSGKYHDRVRVTVMNKKEISDNISEIISKGVNQSPQTFYLILNNAKDNYSHGNHWTAAIITINPDHVQVEYADSSSHSESPAVLKEAVDSLFSPTFRIQYDHHKGVIKQLGKWECAYLALFYVIRHIEKETDKKTHIAKWSNDINDIAALRYEIQSCVLSYFRFKINDKNFQHPEKDKRIEPVNDDGVYKFKPLFIDYQLKGVRNDDLPFHSFIQNSIQQLSRYINEHQSYMTSNYGKKTYGARMEVATSIKEKLESCRGNNQLEKIYWKVVISLNEFRVRQFTSSLIKILESMEAKLKPRLGFDIVRKSDANAQALFDDIVNKLKAVSTDRKVTPNKYSWYGHEIVVNELNKIDLHACPHQHTIKDELIGKLYFITKDNMMDENTKCSEMRYVIWETETMLANSLWGSPGGLIVNCGSRFREALSLLNSVESEEMSKSKLMTYIRENYPGYRNKNKYMLSLWNHSVESDNEATKIEAALVLLRDYLKSGPSSMFSRKYWNRTHVSLVQTALLHFASKDDLTTQYILQYFERKLKRDQIKPDGELLKTLTFISAQNKTTFNLCLDEHYFSHSKPG